MYRIYMYPGKQAEKLKSYSSKRCNGWWWGCWLWRCVLCWVVIGDFVMWCFVWCCVWCSVVILHCDVLLWCCVLMLCFDVVLWCCVVMLCVMVCEMLFVMVWVVVNVVVRWNEWFYAVCGFCWQTNRQTDEQILMVVELLSQLKTEIRRLKVRDELLEIFERGSATCYAQIRNCFRIMLIFSMWRRKVLFL